MLHKNRSRSTGLWKYGFSAPLFMLMLIVSAATVKSEETIQPVAKVILSPLPAETSEKIMLALKLNKLGSGETVNLKESSLSDSNPEEELEIHPDFNMLKRYMLRTLKYPAAPRENKTTGLIIANFSVKGQKVTTISFVKKLHSDIEADVVKALKSYASQLDVPDDTYMVAIKYILEGLAPEADFVPRSMHKNFIGQLSVLAMNGPQPSPKTGMSTEPAMSNPQNDALNQFPGGIKAWSEYISKNLKYPAFARENKIEGRVILSFVVDTDGGIQDIKVLRGIGGGADEEAVRVVAQSPKWRTVVKNGDPAKTAYTLPISFNLNSNTQNTSQNNVLIPTRSSNDDVKDFTEVEVLPEFIDGMAGWSKYLTANLKYPELARKENITGRVIMSFIVEKDGSLSEIKVLRGIGGGADEESVRVLKAAPKWKPGLSEGRPVRVAYTMPIFFQTGSK